MTRSFSFKHWQAILLALMVTAVAVVVPMVLPRPPPAVATQERQLTRGPCNDLDPVFSPDGRRIVFSSDCFGDFDIWVMDANGKHRWRLTSLSGDERFPKWSKDGRWVAFVRTANEKSDIWIVGLGGEEPVNLTDDGAPKENFEWSPSGSFLVYDSHEGGRWNIWVTDVQGRNKIQLTKGEGNNRYPSWSSDGNRVLFSSDRSGQYEIWIINANGAKQTQLTNSSGDNIKPRMSPDGNAIVFLSGRSGKWGVWRMQADGAGQFCLTYEYGAMTEYRIQSWDPGIGEESNPSWDLKGKKIVFSSTPQNYNNDIYVIDPEVLAEVYPLRQIVTVPREYFTILTSLHATREFGDNITPSWNPDGVTILFSSNRSGSWHVWMSFYGPPVFISSYGR